MAMEQDNLSEHNANSTIKKDDERRYKWTQHILNALPWDRNLYDILIRTTMTPH